MYSLFGLLNKKRKKKGKMGIEYKGLEHTLLLLKRKEASFGEESFRMLHLLHLPSFLEKGRVTLASMIGIHVSTHGF